MLKPQLPQRYGQTFREQLNKANQDKKLLKEGLKKKALQNQALVAKAIQQNWASATKAKIPQKTQLQNQQRKPHLKAISRWQ